MNFYYDDLQKCLLNLTESSIPDEVLSDGLMERIRQVLSYKKSNGRLQKPDFQVLIRHFLLREAAQADKSVSLRLPGDGGWPLAEEWEKFGFRVLKTGHNDLVISPLAWRADWLTDNSESLFDEIYLETTVREDGSCPADPFISAITGYETYSCPGQREAVRAALLMPPGETLIVNLPTGSGKSLAGQAPSLVFREEGYLTIFVVPTVGLAIDQERQMRDYLRKNGKKPWPLAWYGGLGKSERSEIRRRIKSGTQRILFTSPEALITSLVKPVFEVAREGMLRYLIIDEAHLVTQWGDDFRPAFQALSGLRNSLLNVCPNDKFRTLLLSATFSEETVDNLSSLFGPKEKVQMISAVHLRPEPQYWFSHASNYQDKNAKVLEALRHVPRPFILYVTTKDESRRWFNILKNEEGYERIEKFDGSTPNNERSRIINSWVENSLDGVVATSAFGVGIDKADVRTVVHATIPETLDRFYQEVGRGGRDGKPSISLLIFENEDWKLPKRLSTPKIVSNEIGFSRWRKLFESKADVKDGCFSVDLDAVRPGLPYSSEENVNWNMRTLLLMVRAGFLDLEVEPNLNDSRETFEYVPTSPLSVMTEVRIRLRRDDHKMEEIWDGIVTPAREKTLVSRQQNFDLMSEILKGKVEVADGLAKLYRMRFSSFFVEVTKVCGGCPFDRLLGGQQKIDYQVPIALPLQKVPKGDFSVWENYFPYLDINRVSVFYESEINIPNIITLLRWLVRECGVNEVSVSKSSVLNESEDWLSLHSHSKSGVLIYRSLDQIDEEPYSPLARVTILEPMVSQDTIKKVYQLDRNFHLIIFPSNMPDSDHHSRLMLDVKDNIVGLDQLLAVVKR